MRAKVTKRGSLAFVETELGQKAVIPWDSLCSFIARYHLEVSSVEGGQMPRCVEYKPHAEEVESDVEEDEYDES
ncbi:MAG: hypothetical protein RXN88_03305 [Acidilobus sp.]|uniref:hypothetical protein n=1 Tax=Acidilobus sp. 7A TaxID=1577685 RepID=UPI000764DFAC|nr:hypothetical protein [Acidilobus sp. 7A]AMD30986.1 hypothetical protein SE86_06585 [Acidilobus sp. 7A]